MRTFPAILLVLMMIVSLLASAAGEEAARSFPECVIRGGEIRRDGEDIACRHITSYSMRTYLSGKTTCGEDVQYEIWDDIRFGTVTYAFAPHRTVQLPEVGETWRESSATPIPCLDNGL